MFGIDALLMGLENNITYKIINVEYLKKVEGVLLLDKDTPLVHKHIYIGTAEDTLHALSRNEKNTEPLTIFVAGKVPEDFEIKLNNNINLIITSLSLTNLHNQLYTNLRVRKNWEIELNKVTPKPSNIFSLLQTAVIITKGSFYLFDPSLNMMEMCTSENQMAKLTEQMCDRRYLGRAAQLKNFNYVLPEDTEYKWYSETYKTEYKMHPINKNGILVGYLLATSNAPTAMFHEFVQLLLLHLVKFFGNTKEQNVSENKNFNMFLDNLFLVSNTETDSESDAVVEDNINQLLKQLPFKPLKYIRFIVTSFSDMSRFASRIIIDLENLFPNTNITSYDGGIVIMLSFSDYVTDPKFDHDAFNKILEKYNGYAVISNAARLSSGFRTEYIQSKEILHMLPKLKFDYEKRYVYLKRYLNYCLIHVSATYLSEHYGHDKMIYFCHPEVVDLMRYDKKNNSDFGEFLFTFILNDCSMAQTAKELNIHRNTVLYKLNKIKELINIDLNDSMEKASILYSCQILRYVTKFQNYGLDI